MSNPPDLQQLRDAITSGDPGRSMPALAALREVAVEEAVPLLLLGLEQEAFLVRSLSCAGLGVKRNEAGWQALVRAVEHDPDANVRAEAANSLVSHGLERAWPLLLKAFRRDDQWLVRCSVLSAVAEHPEAPAGGLLELASLAVDAGDGTVRVGGAEILGRLVKQGQAGPDDGEIASAARGMLQRLQADADHRVVAAALNGLQG
ncbi:HEAT repeat domain-containing protein [Cyanobium sp. CH-040]|uniref:HEAT repeat domain-containing protein n=1 Tax=Cyanobium sp. CH-040 TaxID=2823708 RepID=UPI0020CCB258|nr:HEAT repeat domain-containing protein [Cyanobium sp. CH-040]MCP9926597.1 HEAT repeat domain-containing protein [Cyanobium sp. CH-040]